MSEFKETDVFKNYFGNQGVPNHISVPVSDSYDYLESSITKVTDTSKALVQDLRANGNIDIEGFTDKLKFLLNEVWGDTWGDFTMEGPTGKDPNNSKLPVITFDVVHRIPSKGKTGVKIRPTELILDSENDDYTLILNRKWFDCTVEFMFFNSTNREARRLMERFETFMDTYVGYFKEAGISEMIFQEEVDSRLSKKYNDGIPSTCLHYLMVIERIVVDKIRTTKELRTKIQSKQSSS